VAAAPITSLALRLSASAARDTVHPAAAMVISGERSRVHRYRGRYYTTTLVYYYINRAVYIISRGPAKVFVFVFFFSDYFRSAVCAPESE